MNRLHQIALKGLFTVALATLLSGFSPDKAEAAKCLFVSSYHQGYAWSDGVEQGLRAVLQDKCELRQFDMDTKRKKSDAEKREQALAAKAIIETWQPDVVITADDNAAKYLVQPYYRDAALPFVFCGVNWTVDVYGFPYSNVTGMVEIAPIEPMLERARDVVPGLGRAFYLGADTLTEKKNLKRFQEVAARLGLEMDFALVPTTSDWIDHYRSAQENHDLIILGSNAGIADWQPETVMAAVRTESRQLSVTNHGWMMPFAMIGVTKVPEEQGEWAAKTALRILEGMPVTQIPIVANSRRDIWVNLEVLETAGMDLPNDLVRKAKRVTKLESKS